MSYVTVSYDLKVEGSILWNLWSIEVGRRKHLTSLDKSSPGKQVHCYDVIFMEIDAFAPWFVFESIKHYLVHDEYHVILGMKKDKNGSKCNGKVLFVSTSKANKKVITMYWRTSETWMKKDLSLSLNYQTHSEHEDEKRGKDSYSSGLSSTSFTLDIHSLKMFWSTPNP